MLRIIFIVLLVAITGYIFLQSRAATHAAERPVFLKVDDIAGKHTAKIKIYIHSIFKPDSFQLETLRNDYSNLWAHLNHLFATNDVEAGKEYYTEDWFRQITNHYQESLPAVIVRKDEQHELHIINWASDGLVCTATDSNVVFKYCYPDQSVRTTRATLAVVLLFQGDHWRIDALRVIKEIPLQ